MNADRTGTKACPFCFFGSRQTLQLAVCIQYIYIIARASIAGSRPVAQRERNGDSMRAEYDFSKGKRGAVIPQKGKTRISIFIDNAVLDAFRTRAEKAGTGYQTMMNEALRQYLAEADQPVTEKVLRQVLRQELPEYVAGVTARSKTKSKI